jgi:predicted nucleic acid-binding protein
MSGDSFLLDTNIIIYSIKGEPIIDDFVKDEDDLYISSITYIEALGFPFNNRDEENKITKFCNMIERLYLTEEVEKQTILIRKSNKIKLPDAIIAATAMVHNLTLVTHDIDDFKSIRGLKIMNPIIH